MPRKTVASRRAERGVVPPRRAGQPASHATVIKRYANRRLYDTRRSRYVTIDEVVEMLAAGETIQILEAASDRDVTRKTLMKMLLLEEESGRRDLFVHLHKCPFCERPLPSSATGK